MNTFLYFERFLFSIPVTAAVDGIVLWIGPIVRLLILVNNFWPIRDTYKPSIAATGIENTKVLKVLRILESETVLETPM